MSDTAQQTTKPHTPPTAARLLSFTIAFVLSTHAHVFHNPWHTTTIMVIVCVGYISIGHLTTPYDASNSDLSTPSSTGNLNRNLISQQASRLDAFSGYPSRT